MISYPWHQPTYQQLTASFKAGHGHHAQLFKTEAGLGTSLLIQAFANWLLCQDKQGNQPCGQCKSCLLQAAGNHPDFHLLESVEGKDIGIDQIRDTTAKLQQFAQQGGNSVVYIRHAEKLNEASSNALLKSLEEPKPNTYFLLEVPLQTPMMATIQSRCQTWLLQAPYPLQALEWLETEFPQTSFEDLSTALRLSRNRPLICKDWLEKDRLQARKTFLQTFWRFYKSRDLLLLFKAFDSEKEQIFQQLEWLQSFFADALKAQLGIGQDHWLNPDLAKGIIPFSQGLSAQALLKGQNLLQQTASHLAQINAVNSELMLLDCLSKLIFIFEGQDEPR
ncbi:DNA polymerase III subunit delta' [Pasteurellaceae bacterium RH1A]|nr:DNA polymerase III subunit delta' [Pasteurellaceae bacterium RH1A]